MVLQMKRVKRLLMSSPDVSVVSTYASNYQLTKYAWKFVTHTFEKGNRNFWQHVASLYCCIALLFVEHTPTV